MEQIESLGESNERNAAVAGDAIQFLTFKLDDEEYGVDIMSVREIKAWSDTTRLPNTPEYMLGVMNLRGVIIPIFDLRARFNRESTEPNGKNVVIIVAMGERLIGILVDAVSDIVDASPHMIKPPPAAELDMDDRYVEGLISLETRMIVILDIEHLFDANAVEELADTATKGSKSES